LGALVIDDGALILIVFDEPVDEFALGLRWWHADDGQIGLAHLALGKLLVEVFEHHALLGYEEGAADWFVEAVCVLHDGITLELLLELLLEKANDAELAACSLLDHEALRFIDDHEMFVLIDSGN
jgi:hypothetical protein